MARFGRYQLSNQKDDLDRAILHLTEWILLQPGSWPEPQANILQNFVTLAVTLFLRSNDSEQPEDATYSAKYLRYLRDQPLEMFGFPRYPVTLSLVDALATHTACKAEFLV